MSRRQDAAKKTESSSSTAAGASSSANKSKTRGASSSTSGTRSEKKAGGRSVIQEGSSAKSDEYDEQNYRHGPGEEMNIDSDSDHDIDMDDGSDIYQDAYRSGSSEDDEGEQDGDQGIIDEHEYYDEDEDHFEEEDEEDVDEDDEDDEHDFLQRFRQGMNRDSNRNAVGSDLFETLANMFPMNARRITHILQAIQQREDPSEVMMGLQELGDNLLMANEDSLESSFPSNNISNALVGVMNDPIFEDSPEIMLLACRNISNLIEAFPSSTANLVNSGVVPILTSKLLEIQYIDLAEQAISVSILNIQPIRHGSK